MKPTTKNQNQKPSEYEADSAPLESDKVGYKNPPKHSRFKKGQSGNPHGKSKKTKTLDEVVIAFMGKPKTVLQDGKKVKVAPVELFPEIFFKQFTQGKTKSGETLLKMHGEAIDRLSSESQVKPKPFSWTDQDEKLLKFLEDTPFEPPEVGVNGSAEKKTGEKLDQTLPPNPDKKEEK